MTNLERKLTDIKQYLLDHVRKEPGPLGDDCWIWTLSLSEGYGQVYWNGFGGRAYRVSYQVFVGPIHAGRQVQHKCDRKDCINPKHLGLGGFATNRADVFSQGEPDLTPHEFERLCAELAELDHKADVTDLRRAQIAAQLRRTIRDNRDERRTVIKEHIDLTTAREVLRRIASDFIFIYDLGVDDKGRARMRSSFRRFLAFPMSAKVRAFIGDDVFFGFRQRLSEHQLWVEHGLDEPDEDE